MNCLLKLVTSLDDENPEIIKKIMDTCDACDIQDLRQKIWDLCESPTCDITTFKILLKLYKTNYEIFDVDTNKTILMTACSTKSLSFIKTSALLEYNPDIEIKDNANKTAMDYAIQYDNKQTIKLLHDYIINKLSDKCDDILNNHENLSERYDSLLNKYENIQNTQNTLKRKITKLQKTNKKLKTHSLVYDKQNNNSFYDEQK